MGIKLCHAKDVRAITKALEYLPIYKTKQESSIQFDGEFAHFIPGHTRSIGRGNKAQLYVDDFEAAKTTIINYTRFWF